MTAPPRPFRDILTRWILAVIAIVALPVLSLEVQRPWGRLEGLVEESEGALSYVAQEIPVSDLVLMNRFTLEVLASPSGAFEDPRSAAAALWFFLEGDAPPPESTFRDTLEAQEARPLDHAQVVADFARWSALFSAQPDPPALREAFRNTRVHLQRACESLERVGLEVDDVYLTLDTGVASSGYFAHNVALLIGALPWYDDAVFPGQAIDVTKMNGIFWRASYLPSLGGAPGSFGHNPMHDPILPRFETDEWGTWYSVWYAVEAEPGQYDSFTLDIDASAVRRMMAGIALAVVVTTLCVGLVVVFVSHRLALWVSRPVAALVAGARAVTESRFDHLVPAIGQGEFVSLIDTFNQMILGLRERVNLLTTLEKVLSPELAETAAREGLVLGGQVANVTVLFTDFAGFSTLTRDLEATRVVEALNDYFVELVPLIRQWGGFPDKYIGDAIVAIFGAPVRLTNHAERAIRCAVDMQRRVREINERRRAAGKVVFEMRIGLNSGDVVVGAIGCNEKLEYTSIGESTNLANRMESICPIGHVMASDASFRAAGGKVPDDIRVAEPQVLPVKGYPEPVKAWPLYVSDLLIRKNMAATRREDFYLYEQREGTDVGRTG